MRDGVLGLIGRHREERVLRAICLGLAVFNTRGKLEAPESDRQRAKRPAARGRAKR